MMTLGILSACSEENSLIRQALTETTPVQRVGGRDFHQGELDGMPVVVAFSQWGKVAAASTATLLIERFDVSGLIFTGVAGGLHSKLKLGDVVVASALAQHDMNASPLFPRHEIPLLGKTWFEPSGAFTRTAISAAEAFLKSPTDYRIRLQEDDGLFANTLNGCNAYSGQVLSGDRFVHELADTEDLRARFPEALCVEMEGAAVAQVCEAFEISYAIIRTISDTADGDAPSDFAKFLNAVAASYSLGIMREFVRRVGSVPEF